MRKIDNPDTDAWRQRLATLVEGYDLSSSIGFRDAFEVVEEAAAETSLVGLRRIAAALQWRGVPIVTRDNGVASILLAWGGLSPAERGAPPATEAERRNVALDVAEAAQAAHAAVGTPGEAAAVERLRATAEWLAGVTPGLGS